jgi:hypothetical protein
MKGPRSRHRHNVQRVWECPACSKRVFESPRVTYRICVCKGPDAATAMRLIELPSPWRKKPAEAPPPTDAHQPDA